MRISFIVPGRNNLKYFKWSYESIRKNQGNHEVEICFADDASTDGTWDYVSELASKDTLLKIYKNDTGIRQGHTILYDKLINDYATNDICIIWHCDMYLCPGALDAIEKHLKEKTIVSLTRIEPPLHPKGPEKVLLDCGVEPEEFNEDKLLQEVNRRNHELINIQPHMPDNTSEGIFAPWAFWKKDFQEIGGHDPLYAPQSKEDSDIFNRFQLNGVKFVQTWEGFVYHMTCRGSRRNTVDKAKNIYEDSPEWLAQNMRSTRNFIRKWGHFVKHDSLMKPIIPPKYDIGIKIKGGTSQLLEILEPWCSTILLDDENQVITSHYLDKEQSNTIINLKDKIKTTPFNTLENEIIVEINQNTFTQQDYQIIQELSSIIQDSDGGLGEFEIGNLKLSIISLNTYEKENIICRK